MKAYSEDLRKRVIESYEEGKEKGEIIKIFKMAKYFKVKIASVWQRLKKLKITRKKKICV